MQATGTGSKSGQYSTHNDPWMQLVIDAGAIITGTIYSYRMLHDRVLHTIMMYTMQFEMSQRPAPIVLLCHVYHMFMAQNRTILIIVYTYS